VSPNNLYDWPFDAHIRRVNCFAPRGSDRTAGRCTLSSSSRTNPQFNIDVLPEALAAAGVGYRHLPSLGGRRHHRENAMPSPNTLWRNASFRNYADYAGTEAFRVGMEELEALSRDKRCAIMCAEAVWWRCHRRIIADYLLADGIPVVHIMGHDKIVPAKVTPGARALPGGALVYPAAENAPCH
jgi:uncharacterized protein (DUF488 family)